MKTQIRVLNCDGEIFEADDASDLVHQLKEASLAEATTDAEYMEGFASRAKMVDGTIVPTDGVENFIASLIEIGELKETNEDAEKPKKKGGKK